MWIANVWDGVHGGTGIGVAGGAEAASEALVRSHGPTAMVRAWQATCGHQQIPENGAMCETNHIGILGLSLA